MKMKLWNSTTTALLTLFLLVACWFVEPRSAYAADDYGTVTEVTPSAAGLGQDIQVKVQNLAKLVNYAKCTDGHQPCTEKKIILYLDGLPITGLTPYATNLMSGSVPGTLTFHLQRNPEAKDAWNQIIGSPQWRSQTTQISVGIADGLALPSAVKGFTFVVVPRGWALFYLLLILAVLVAFGLLVQKTNLLRDSGAEPGGDLRKPFSLARSQMAWWFFLVVAAYLFIGMITGDFATSITSTVLVLIGISATTAISGTVIDSNKDNSPTNQAATAEAQVEVTAKIEEVQQEIDQTKAALPAGTSAAKAALPAAKLATEKAKLEAQDKKLKNVSEGWYLDILSDADGVSFHRFQIAAWTLVLGIVFVVAVYKTLAMPEFDQSLLTLLGISAGTYIGFKIPEPTVPTVPAPAPQAVTP